MNYTFLSWCPVSTHSLRPITCTGEKFSGDKEIRNLFGDRHIIYKRFGDEFNTICYHRRLDGFFIFHIELATGHTLEDSEVLVLSEVLCDLIKERLNHVHYFHPVANDRPNAERRTLKIKPIQLADISNVEFSKLFSDAEECNKLKGDFDNEDCSLRIFRILESDKLLISLLSKKDSIYIETYEAGEKAVPRVALLRIRENFARVFDKFFAVRNQHRKTFYKKNLFWLSLLIAYAIFIYPHWRSWASNIDPSDPSIKCYSPILSFIILSPICVWVLKRYELSHFIARDFNNAFFKKVTLLIGALIRNKWVLLAGIAYFFLSVLNLPLLYPMHGMEVLGVKIEPLPLPTLDRHSVMFREDDSFFISVMSGLFGLALVYCYIDIFLKHVKIIRLGRSTVGTLSFGSICSNAIKKISSHEPCGHYGDDFANACKIIEMAIASERSNLKQKLAIYAAVVICAVFTVIIHYAVLI